MSSKITSVGLKVFSQVSIYKKLLHGDSLASHRLGTPRMFLGQLFS